MPSSSIIDVVKSLQKARPTADNPVSLIMSLMNMPDVDQHTVAMSAIKIPDNLVEMGFGDRRDNASSLSDYGANFNPSR
jgi:hypothetical protein